MSGTKAASQLISVKTLYSIQSPMNRTPILFDSDQTDTLTPSSPESLGFNRSFFLPAQTPASTETVDGFSSFAPTRYESGYAYPLIVWLHGRDSDQFEIERAMPHVSTQNFVAVSARGNRPSYYIPGAYSWGDSPGEVADAADKVEQCIKLAKAQFNIHCDRIFLAGSSTGGTLALRLAMEYPGICAGAVSLGGRLPRGNRPLKRFQETQRTPLMLAVSASESYSFDDLKQDITLIHSAGFPLEVMLCPRGDYICSEMLAHVNTWIMKQVCPQSVSAHC